MFQYNDKQDILTVMQICDEGAMTTIVNIVCVFPPTPRWTQNHTTMLVCRSLALVSLRASSWGFAQL